MNDYDGNLMIHEPTTNDLVILSPEMGLVNKFSSQEQVTFSKEKKMRKIIKL